MNAQTKHTPGARLPVFTVKRQEHSTGTFGVYRDRMLIEGGFFSHEAAMECRAEYERNARAAIAKAVTP